MSWSLSGIQAGIKANLATIEGLHVFDYNVQSPALPAAIVMDPESIDYDATFQRGTDIITLPILVIVMGTERSSSDELSQFIASDDPNSIRFAIRADKSLNGTVADAKVVNIDQFANYNFGDAHYPGCKVHLEIWARGN